MFYYSQCCSEHLCTSIFVDICEHFSRLYFYKSNFWDRGYAHCKFWEIMKNSPSKRLPVYTSIECACFLPYSQTQDVISLLIFLSVFWWEIISSYAYNLHFHSEVKKFLYVNWPLVNVLVNIYIYTMITFLLGYLIDSDLYFVIETSKHPGLANWLLLSKAPEPWGNKAKPQGQLISHPWQLWWHQWSFPHHIVFAVGPWPISCCLTSLFPCSIPNFLLIADIPDDLPRNSFCLN